MCTTHVDSSDARGDIPHRNNLGIITMPTLSIMASYRRSAPQLLERPAGAVRPASLAASGVSLQLAVSIGSRPGKCHFNYFRRDHNRHQRLLSTTAPMYTTTPFGFFLELHRGACTRAPTANSGRDTDQEPPEASFGCQIEQKITRISLGPHQTVPVGWAVGWMPKQAKQATAGSLASLPLYYSTALMSCMRKTLREISFAACGSSRAAASLALCQRQAWPSDQGMQGHRPPPAAGR
jgi:hypothetical protein